MRRFELALLLLLSVMLVGGTSVLSACGEETTSRISEAVREAAAPPAPEAPHPAEPAARAAQQPAPKAETSPSQTPARKFVAPIRGVAEIGYLRPVTKVVGNEVVTTIRIKNLSNAPIAGLRVDEYWFDAQGNPLPSDYEIVKKPLMPGEVVEIELRVPKDPRMNRNQYQFRHANGQIKPRLMQKF